MGSSYFFNTEVRIGGTWYCIDPRFLHLGWQDAPMIYKITYTYANHSRSFFGDTYDQLWCISKPIRLEETSSEFRIAKIMDWNGDDNDIAKYYDSILRVFSYADLKAMVPDKNTHTYHGIYHKDRIVRFENGDIEDLFEDDIAPEDYSELDDEAKKVFQYYEWDDPMSWQVHIPVLVQKIAERIDEFTENNWHYDIDDVRVIMYECC